MPVEIITGTEKDAYDVIVLGSGAGGLTAAATAAHAGRSVLVLEKASLIGGTSAVSGGMLWIGANHLARAAGLEDSVEDAAVYVREVGRGRGRDELLDAAVTRGDEMLRFVEDELGLRFIFLEDFPDYCLHLAGSRPGGRTIEPALFDAESALGSLRPLVRVDGRLPFTMQEYERWGAFTRFPIDELTQRQTDGKVAKGQALVASLLAANVSLGVTIAVDARADRLVTDGGRIAGVTVGDRTISARDGVVIAAGGFEWDDKLADSMLAARIFTKCSPPTNEGDGYRLAQRVGASFGGLRNAWWAPMSIIPGDLRDGRQIGTLLRFERQGPGSIMVNRDGKRFANESQNYNDLARSLQSWDSANYRPLNSPVHIVFDQRYLENYGLLTHRAGQPTPEWLVEAATLEELAAKIDVPADTLTATVERFNEHAVKGEDPDFGRGVSAYDRYWGDDENPYPNPSLAPLDTGPFYALAVVNGCFGTSGGIATDGLARVIDTDGVAIQGLYAVGNSTENAYGAGYPGAGATLGPIMTMGYLAGRTVAGLERSEPAAAPR
ncbi:FAD-dependent oxidoreductase [Microbacterium sp. NPDC076895]|uniref:FAD-dependent oxidoreductase n=1 Tax=Microbacterium sp. NPDC076895 TaxID=3154957 RepID=UPI003428CCC8